MDMLTDTCFTKEPRFRVCRNCVHYKSQWFNEAVCHRSKETKRTFDPVNGWEESVLYNTCREERGEFSPILDKCGPDAKYYEAK